jgi:hypothetical protein
MSYYGWQDWIGLPHRIGADPRDGEAACCLQMVYAIYEEVGLPIPEFDRAWIRMAKHGQWADLYEEFEAATTTADKELWALTPLIATDSFGIGVVVQDDLLLCPHHRRGVVAIPAVAMPSLTFHRPL